MRLKKITVGLLAGVALSGGSVGLTDKMINPYTDKGQVLEMKVDSDIQKGEAIDVSKISASVTLNRWNGEESMTVTPEGDFGTPSRALFSKTQKMDSMDGKKAVVIDPTTSNDGVNIDITLNEKPAGNVFKYFISGYQDMDFFYQPVLTQKEIDEGASRPDNVVGSYAVYSKTKADHIEGKTNYATGKLFHIYRPKAIDAKGNEQWADLTYSNGVLEVIVDQAYLDSATYPVTIDPTFGYTTQGGTTVTSSGIKSTQATPATSGTITKMTIYQSRATSDSLAAAIYDDDGTTHPGPVDAVDSGNTTYQVAGWYDVNVSYAVTAGVLYWISHQSTSGVHYYDAAPANTAHTINTAFDSWPNLSGAGSFEARMYSQYATYTSNVIPLQPPQVLIKGGNTRIKGGNTLIK